MQYAESIFAIAYLLIALLSGVTILQRRRDSTGKLMGWAVLILWFGDMFHLLPRVLRYVVEDDLSGWLDAGTLITSITMTVFYVLLFLLLEKLYGEKHDGRYTEMLIRDLAGIRVLACVAPLALAILGETSFDTARLALIASLVRNIPFMIIGAIVAVKYYKRRNDIPTLRPVWLLIVLSFLFYLPVAFGAMYLPILGMLMVPKTVCYIIMILRFVRYAGESGTEN